MKAYTRMSRSCIVVSCATNRLHRLVQTTRQTSEIALIDSRGNPAGRIHATRYYRTICRTMYRTIGYRCSSSHSRYIVRYTAVNCHAACDVSGKCTCCVTKLKVIGPRQAHAQFAEKSRTVTLANYDIAMLYMMFLLVTVLMKYRKIVGRPRRRSHRRVWVRSYLRKRRAAGTRDCNPGIPNPGIPDFFSIPKSRDWMAPIPGFRD
jgi:hypothetical protein